MGQRKIYLAPVNPQNLIMIPTVNLLGITPPHLRTLCLYTIGTLIVTLDLATIVIIDFAESVTIPILLPVFLLVGIAMDMTVIVSAAFVDVHTLNLSVDMHLVLPLPVVPLPLGLIPITTRIRLIMILKI